MVADQTLHPARRRFRKKRWAAAGVLVFATAGATAVYRHFSDPQRVRQLAQDYLRAVTHRKVVIDTATFSLAEGIQLRGVSMTNQPDGESTDGFPDPPAEELFSCNEIAIMYDPWSLLMGRLQVTSLAAIRPTLTLVHQESTGWADIAALLRSITSGKKTGGAAPPIELREARVRVLHRTTSGDRLVEDIQLTVRGRRASESPELFNIVWQDVNDPHAHGHSQVDLATGLFRNVTGGLPAMSIRAVMLAVNAGFEGADVLTELLGIEGRVRVRDYDFSAADHGAKSATIDLKDAAISIPVSQDEQELSPAERFVRFHHVQGTVGITAASIQADFRGLFHESPCTVSATISGTLAQGVSLSDLSLKAHLSMERLRLPDRSASDPQMRFISRWPPITEFFNRYDPHGEVDLECRVEKAAGTDQVKVQEARFTVLGGDASFLHFPYRCVHLSGQVNLGPDGVLVENICGTHGKAQVCVNGWMEAPTKPAPAWFVVSGKNVSIDEEFLQALRPRYRTWFQELQLDGEFDGLVSVSRDRSPDSGRSAPWETRVDAQFAGLSSVIPKTNVGLSGAKGYAVFQDDYLAFGAEGGAGGGWMKLEGSARTAGEGFEQLAVQIDAQHLEMDDSFVAELPPELRQVVDSMHARGCASLTSKIAFNAKDKWRHATDLQLRNLSVVPQPFPIRITGGFADIRMETDRWEVLRARGYYGESELFAKGRWERGAEENVDFIVEADSLLMDDPLVHALPPNVHRGMAEWHSPDPVHVDLRLRKRGGEWSTIGNVELTNATVYHRRFRPPLSDVSAAIAFEDSHLRCSDARAVFDGASVHLDFETGVSKEGFGGSMQIDAQGLVLDEELRDLFPPHAQAIWDDLAPSGRIDLAIEDLSFLCPATGGPTTWSVRGLVYPRRVRIANDKFVITNGAIQFEGVPADRLGGVMLDGRLKEADLSIYGQPLRNANAGLYLARTAHGDGSAGARDLRGDIHGGTATSQVELNFDKQQVEYQMATSMQQVDLAQWLDAWRDSPLGAEENQLQKKETFARDVRGTMSAQLHLSGMMNDATSRAGGGQMEIRQGYIYKLPILMAIINVLNISMPTRDVLSEAFTRFYITGNTAQLVEIEVTGENLNLVGSGTMSLADYSVDLNLINTSGGFSNVPVIAELWQGATRELVELRVTGPVSQPQVRATPFRGITDEIKKLFQRKNRPIRSVGSQ